MAVERDYPSRFKKKKKKAAAHFMRAASPPAILRLKIQVCIFCFSSHNFPAGG